MALRDRLRERSSAIAGRWLGDTLNTYSGDASAAFKRQKDPFANPVGHALRVGLNAVVAALVEGEEPDEICPHLDEIIRIRAIQEFAPSEALSFVFLLKEATRAELGKAVGEPSVAAELAEFEGRIDRIGLLAFDSYVASREKVYQLRVNEVKRGVSKIVQRMNRQGSPARMEDASEQPETLNRAEAQRGGGG
jgi:hypothetical protein